MNNQGPFRIGQFTNKIDEIGMKAAQVCVALSFVSKENDLTQDGLAEICNVTR